MVSGSKKWTLYALELEKGKWFVDVTAGEPDAQLKKHKDGHGTEWTRRYAPVKVAYTHELGDISEEDALKYAGKFLRKYLEHYGDGNVRSGDIPDVEPKKAKFKQEKKGFKLWNLATQIIVIVILVGIIGYLLLDKFYLTPSTALTIIQ